MDNEMSASLPHELLITFINTAKHPTVMKPAIDNMAMNKRISIHHVHQSFVVQLPYKYSLHVNRMPKHLKEPILLRSSIMVCFNSKRATDLGEALY